MFIVLIGDTLHGIIQHTTHGCSATTTDVTFGVIHGQEWHIGTLISTTILVHITTTHITMTPCFTDMAHIHMVAITDAKFLIM